MKPLNTDYTLHVPILLYECTYPFVYEFQRITFIIRNYITLWKYGKFHDCISEGTCASSISKSNVLNTYK